MAGRISDAAANAVLDLMFGSGAQGGVAPATYYVGLSTTQPTNSGGGVTEPSGGSYARVAVANNAANWPTADGRTKMNGDVIQFPVAGADWGTVGWVVFYGASSGGTFYAWANLAAPQTVVSGGAVDFPVGAISISMPGS